LLNVRVEPSSDPWNHQAQKGQFTPSVKCHGNVINIKMDRK